jgi:hypothetical protein
MSWLGLFLVGIGVSDLVFSVRPARRVPELVGAAVVVGGGLLCGLTGPRDVVALLAMAALVLAWGDTVTRGFGAGPPWLPLLVGGGSVALVLAVAGAAGHADGLLGPWLEGSPLPGLATMEPDRALLLAGVLLVQLSTGNVVVRLVLAATGSRNPRPPLSAVVDHGQSDERPLKGGRLLGPMERLVIVGLGLAGQLTAASIVIAAKGLLRFPELQAARDEGGPGIHEVTEYFLVGSFVSWLVALSALVLA